MLDTDLRPYSTYQPGDWGPLLKSLSLWLSLKFCKVEITFKSQMFENGTNRTNVLKVLCKS